MRCEDRRTLNVINYTYYRLRRGGGNSCCCCWGSVAEMAELISSDSTSLFRAAFVCTPTSLMTLLHPGRGAMQITVMNMSVCLSVRSHNSKLRGRTLSIFVHITCCDLLYAYCSSFTDDVMFSYHDTKARFHQRR